MQKDFKRYCNAHGLRFNLTEGRARKYMIDEFGMKRYSDYENEMELRKRFNAGEIKNHNFSSTKVINNQEFSSDKIYGFPKNFKESVILEFLSADPTLAMSTHVLDFFSKNKFNNVYDLGCYNGLLISFLASVNPEKRFYGIDIEQEILQFSKEEFKEYNNLKFIGGDFLNINLSKEKKSDFIYSCAGFYLDNKFKDKYDTYEIRKDVNYKNALLGYKKLFKNIDVLTKPDSIFMPLLRIGNCEDFVAFVDAAASFNWLLLKDEFKDISWFDSNQSKRESIPHIALQKKTNKVDFLKNEFLLEAIDNVFTKDKPFKSRLLFDNIKKSKTILQSSNLESNEFKLYLETGNPDLEKQKFYAFIAFELGNVLYEEFDEVQELDRFMIESGFTNP
jgi:SAM-dependent methyltransferase